MKIIALLSIFISMTALAQWNHLTEKQGEVTIDIDYIIRTNQSGTTCYKCSDYTMAGPLWFNVSGVDATEVRIILTSIRFYAWSTTPNTPYNKISYKLDLAKQAEGHFSGQFSDATKMLGDQFLELAPWEKQLEIFISGYGGTSHFDQEIAVVIDGKWLKNFSVNLNSVKKI